MAQSIESMTLRSKLNEAERILRELIHHVEHGYIPQAHLLRRNARKGNDPKEQNNITDLTIRSSVEKTLASDKFTQQVADQLQEYLSSIDADLRGIIGN